MPWSGISGPNGRFTFLIINHPEFQSGFTSLHSHQQRMSLPLFTSFPAFSVMFFLALRHSEKHKIKSQSSGF